MTTNENKTVRPEQLADELGVSGKLVRAYLRRTFPRAAEAKGSVWVLDSNVAEKVREHFLSRRPIVTTSES
jgi:hypothetical protein